MKTKKHTRSKDAAFKALDELIAFCGATHGSIADVHRRLNSRLATPIVRTQFEKWLIADKDRRVEPSFGAGLLILEVFADLKRTTAFRDWRKS
jgi:hypothetical protein